MNKIISETSNVINLASKNRNYLGQRAKKVLMESNVLGKIKYNAPLIAGETDENKYKIYKIIHKAARYVLNDYCFKKSISYIMKKLEWKMPEEIIDEASAKFGHRIITSKEPEGLSDRIRRPRSRQNAECSYKPRTRTRRSRGSIIKKSIENYNRIPGEMKNLQPKFLRRKLKKTCLKPSKAK